jgi:hypothetical protein
MATTGKSLFSKLQNANKLREQLEKEMQEQLENETQEQLEKKLQAQLENETQEQLEKKMQEQLEKELYANGCSIYLDDLDSKTPENTAKEICKTLNLNQANIQSITKEKLFEITEQKHLEIQDNCNYTLMKLLAKKIDDFKQIDDIWLYNKKYITDLLLLKFNRYSEDTYTWVGELFNWMIKYSETSNMHADYVQMVRLFLVAAFNKDGMLQLDQIDERTIQQKIYMIIKNNLQNNEKYINWLTLQYKDICNNKDINCNIVYDYQNVKKRQTSQQQTIKPYTTNNINPPTQNPPILGRSLSTVNLRKSTTTNSCVPLNYKNN